MSKSATYTFPLPRSVNHIYSIGVSKSGKPFLYKKKSAKDWQRTASEYILEQGRAFFKGAVSIEIDYFIPNTRVRYDIMNLDKLVCDTLQDMRVIEDDHLVICIKQRKHLIPKPYKSKCIVIVNSAI